MKKSDLVQQLSSRADISRAAAGRAFDALFDPASGIISDALRGGDKVQITGFGSFRTREREARTGRNPRTGKEITIGSSRSAAFRPSQELVRAMGGTHGSGPGK